MSVDSQNTVEYREIKGHPGYRVSNTGDVQSCWKKCGLPKGKGSMRIMGEKWVSLKPRPNKNGHLQVLLYRECGRIMRYVHQLVLEAFVGPRPEGLICRHFPDRNPRNNRVENLRWGTPKENYSDSIEHGTSARGDNSGTAKITAVDAMAIYEEVNRLRKGRKRVPCGTLIRLGKKYGIDPQHVHLISVGKSWRHLFAPTTDNALIPDEATN